jgi:hypothetical protein
MRKRTNPALLAVFVFALLIAVMVPAVAAASSHWSVIREFNADLRGATRPYTHDDMNITLHTTSNPNALYKTYRIELWRDNTLAGDDYIGYKTGQRNGYTVGRWTSTGAGNYYFKYSKAQDGFHVLSNDVHMWCD